MLIDQDGNNLGVVSNVIAKKMALEAKLDLVEVAPKARPPVCKIMDYGKYKYEKGIKEKKQKPKSGKLKIIRLSPGIGENDIETKIKSIKKFLEEGSKVSLQLRYKGREKAHKDVGYDTIDKILKGLSDFGVAQKPSLQGSVLSCTIEPKK